MRGAVFRGLRTVVVEDLPDPVCGPADVVIDVAGCGLCGSDVRWYSHGGPALGSVQGHEYAGTVREIGSAVTNLRVGDRIAVNPVIPCGVCDRCRQGSINLCAGMQANTGGFADRLLIRGAATGQVFVLPEHITTTEAAILEPLGVAARAVRLAGDRRDEPALVLGLGPIGQCIVQVLKAAGYSFVVGVDVVAARREMAARFGADAVLDPADGDLVEAMRALVGWGRSGSHPYEWALVGTVFECSGAPSALAGAVGGLLRSGGTVVMVALYEQPPEPDLNLLVRKELRLVGSLGMDASDFERGYRWLEAGAVRLAPLISHEIPLERVADAYDLAGAREGAVKVMVVP